jgi:salicylate hydroxylase
MSHVCIQLTHLSSWNVHRYDLQQVLHAAAVQRGVDIRMDCTVVSVEEATPSVTLKSGQVVTGDLIVGADGIFPCLLHNHSS